jgi:hypothetical protein
MSIVGFNFSKIVVEKKQTIKGKINISNNVSITNVEESSLSFGGSKQKGLKFTFNFITNYEPKIGSLDFTGDILYIEDAKKVEDILKAWKKDKKLPKEITTSILNTTLNRCNIQALILSQQINLPPPIPMPKVESAKKAAK